MSVPTRALIAAAALTFVCLPAIGADRSSSAMLHVRAFNDLVAAEECLAHGYLYMVRIGPHDVICTRSPAGIEKRVVRTQDVVDAAVHAMRGR